MKKALLPLLLSAMVLSGCVAGGSDYNTLQNQVQQQQQTISQLNQQLSGFQPAQADTWSQVQTMRQELAAMRGELDTLSRSFNQVGGAYGMADTLARHSRAMRLMEAQLAMNLQLDEPALAPPSAGTPTYDPNNSLAGYASPSIPAQPQAPLTPQTPQGMAPQSPQNFLPATPTQPVVPNTPIAGAAADTAQALYDNGIKAFNERNYDQALTSFTDFTNTFPNHSLISNAWFWQGETQYQRKDYAAAALAYEKVISSFPNSNKAPSAYLKQGMSFLQLNKKDAAKERLTQLTKKFPKAVETTRAQQILKESF